MTILFLEYLSPSYCPYLFLNLFFPKYLLKCIPVFRAQKVFIGTSLLNLPRGLAISAKFSDCQMEHITFLHAFHNNPLTSPISCSSKGSSFSLYFFWSYLVVSLDSRAQWIHTHLLCWNFIFCITSSKDLQREKLERKT